MIRISLNPLTQLLLAAIVLVTVQGGVCGQEYRVVAAPQSLALLSLDFSRDSSMIATGGDSVRIYDARTGRFLHQVSPPPLTRRVRFSPANAKLLATAGDDGIIRLWRVFETEPSRLLKGHSTMLVDIAFSPDGKLIASGGVQFVEGKEVLTEFRLWDVETGETLQSLTFDNRGVRCVAFSENGRLVAFSKHSADPNRPSTIEVYDIQRWQLVRSVPFTPGSALSVCFHPDSSNLLISGGVCVPRSETSCRLTGHLWLAALGSDQPARLLRTPESDYFRSADFTPKGDRFATGTSTVREQLNRLGEVRGRSLVAQIQMREAETGDVIWSQDGEIGDPYDTQVSPDGKLVGCCSGEHVLIFDAESGKRVRTITIGD